MKIFSKKKALLALQNGYLFAKICKKGRFYIGVNSKNGDIFKITKKTFERIKDKLKKINVTLVLESRTATIEKYVLS